MRTPIYILVVALSFTRCDSGPNTSDSTKQITPIRTLYATSKIEWGSSLAELPNGDIIVSGYGRGFMLPNDATAALPFVIQIRPDGSLVRAFVVNSIGRGYVSGVRSAGNILMAAIYRYDDANRSTKVCHVDFNGNVTQTLSESTEWHPSRHVSSDAAGILLIANWSGNRAHELMKIAPNGSVAWTYQFPDDTFITNADSHESGDTFLFGRPTDSSFRISRIGPVGNERWTREYWISASEPVPHNLGVGSDHFVTIGYTSDGDGTRHVFVTRFDLDGTINWEKEVVSGFRAKDGAIEVLPNNDIVFEFSVSDQPTEGYFGRIRTHLMGLSSDGGEIWRESFEADYPEADVREFFVTSDHRLVILGNLETSGVENTGDIVVWQLDL